MSSANKLWFANEIAEAVGSTSNSNWSASGISIDSRTLKPGDLFIALRGPNFDGHDFIGDAFERGASGSLISSKPANFINSEKLILVEDTYEGLKNYVYLLGLDRRIVLQLLLAALVKQVLQVQ